MDLEAKEMSISRTRGQSNVRSLQKAGRHSLVAMRMADSPGHDRPHVRVNMEGVWHVVWLLGRMLMCTETLPPGSGPWVRGKGQM